MHGVKEIERACNSFNSVLISVLTLSLGKYGFCSYKCVATLLFRSLASIL